MTRIKLPYIHRFRDRHGKVRFYFRRDGYARVALPGLPGSAEFMAAYQAAVDDKPLPIGASRTKPGSIDALAVAWYGSPEFRQLSEITQATYRNIVERLREDHGDKPVVALEPHNVRKLVAKKADTPSAANRLLSILRLMMRYAVEHNWRRDDPTQGVRRLRVKTEGIHTWTEDEIAAFEAHWPAGGRARLALALLLYTGQRRSDVVRMGRQHVRSGAITVRQRKTGAWLSIPLHPALREALDAAPPEHLAFLMTQQGKPFSGPGFSNWFVDCAREAGLPKGCCPHGLRKAAARRLAEAGCSVHEIAAVTGHTTLSEVQRYTKAAEQGRLAEAAIARIGKVSAEP